MVVALMCYQLLKSLCRKCNDCYVGSTPTGISLVLNNQGSPGDHSFAIVVAVMYGRCNTQKRAMGEGRILNSLS